MIHIELEKKVMLAGGLDEIIEELLVACLVAQEGVDEQGAGDVQIIDELTKQMYLVDQVKQGKLEGTMKEWLENFKKYNNQLKG